MLHLDQIEMNTWSFSIFMGWSWDRAFTYTCKNKYFHCGKATSTSLNYINTSSTIGQQPQNTNQCFKLRSIARLKQSKDKQESCSFWRERTQGRTLSCGCFANQPLDFDEVTKCDEKQLNASVITETSCPPGISLFVNMAADARLWAKKAVERWREVPGGHAAPRWSSISLSTVLCLVLAVSHTTE